MAIKKTPPAVPVVDEQNTEQFGIRCSKSLKAALAMSARAGRRKPSEEARVLMEEGLKRKGFLK